MADRPQVDRSSRYLFFFTGSALVAAIGAVLLLATNHDAVGTALLLGGDTSIIAGLVIYIRRAR